MGGAIFDRDRGEKFFDIYVDVADNYQGNGNTNTNSTMVKLVLLDVNDNAPELPSPSSLRMSLSENSEPVRGLVNDFWNQPFEGIFKTTKLNLIWENNERSNTTTNLILF